MNIGKKMKISFISDFGITKGYKSSVDVNKENTITHLFSKFTSNLNLKFWRVI